ncbi:MAG TPA: hypothetical protein VGZ00_09055 [Candidatus Baltobacteraceae bacterium]|nr:hypothetical protein [Candidatus Baltobacteraceae bacterium]
MFRFLPWILSLVVAVTLTNLCVNVPMFDEWTWAPLVLALHDGRFHAVDLWAQQQSHRSPLPTLLMLALASLSHWNIRIEAFASLIFATATQGMLAFLTCRLSAHRAWSAFGMISLLIFSFIQAENWIWGFQLSWFMVNAFLIAVVVLLADEDPRPWRLGLAIICAASASCCLIFGFGAWIAGGILLARQARARTLWAIAAMTMILVFGWGYHAPNFENGWALKSVPVDIAQFVLTYLGAPLGSIGGRWFCEVLGALELVAWVVLAGRSPNARPWLAIAAFTLSAAVFEAVGRSGNGVDAATAFRYTTTSSLGWIALVGVAAHSLDRKAWRRMGTTLMVLIVLGNGLGYLYGYSLAGLQRDAAFAVRHLDEIDDVELSEYTNDPRQTRRLVQLLREAHLGPFSEKLP